MEDFWGHGNQPFWMAWLVLRVLLVVGLFTGLTVGYRQSRFEGKQDFLRAGLATIGIAILSYIIISRANSEILGWSSVLLGPFLNGFFFVLLYWYLGRRRDASRMLPRYVELGLGLPAILAGLQLLVLFVLLLEGIICLLMAAPFYLFFTVIGASLAYALLRALQPRHSGRPVLWCLALVLVLPGSGQYLENRWVRQAEPARVSTEIIINAPPETVFRHVGGFSPIPAGQPPRHLAEGWFLLGLPAPQVSTLACQGPQCHRTCEFNQNIVLNERVTDYQPPHRLAFDVLSVVGPQDRLTGVDPHVMPGGVYFDNRHGRFDLTALPGGRTLLKGTTEYTVHSSINWYARLWADHLLHVIHRRVLEHVKTLAERGSAP